MNFSRLFIFRPVATSLLMVAILLAGLFSYRLLPISALPQFDYPTIQVVTLYPGASPEIVTSTITAPLERQFGRGAWFKANVSLPALMVLQLLPYSLISSCRLMLPSKTYKPQLTAL